MVSPSTWRPAGRLAGYGGEWRAARLRQRVMAPGGYLPRPDTRSGRGDPPRTARQPSRTPGPGDGSHPVVVERLRSRRIPAGGTVRPTIRATTVEPGATWDGCGGSGLRWRPWASIAVVGGCVTANHAAAAVDRDGSSRRPWPPVRRAAGRRVPLDDVFRSGGPSRRSTLPSQGRRRCRDSPPPAGSRPASRCGTVPPSAGWSVFYDPVAKELKVRGTDMTPYRREVIAHELTHARDDQLQTCPTRVRRGLIDEDHVARGVGAGLGGATPVHRLDRISSGSGPRRATPVRLRPGASRCRSRC